ncbi:MAG TPA: hypothetical protein VNN22_13260 [Verrucomicrobiae bacterium]|nr:hypothetical protein [Verrucomicrobiae bacterium]
MKHSNPSKNFTTGFSKRLCFRLCIGSMLLLSQARAQQTAGESTKPGTLAYHLATNAAARAEGRYAGYNDKVELVAPHSTRLTGYADATWSRACWLHDVQGLSATPIGLSNSASGQGLPTMVSPRHYVCATHMHPEGYLKAFLDTNNVVYWRKSLQRVDVGGDTSVGILDADLPPSVGFLPVLPANFTNYLPTTFSNIVQGIGMNQDMYLFSQPMTFGSPAFVNWDSSKTAPFGLATNWNATLRGGDSSNPDMLLVSNQLVLVSHNFVVQGGPNYACQIPAINAAMHLLSTNNHVRTDYQLTEFPLTNWPVIR